MQGWSLGNKKIKDNYNIIFKLLAVKQSTTKLHYSTTLSLKEAFPIFVLHYKLTIHIFVHLLKISE